MEARPYAKARNALAKVSLSRIESIEEFVAEVEDIVGYLDAEIENLYRERSDISDLVRPVITLYESLGGDFGSLKDPASGTPKDMDDLHQGQELKEKVLSTAEGACRQGICEPPGTVDDETIEAAVLQLSDLKKLPWANPRAVIGTILTRSGRFEKVERGVYRLKRVEA